MKYCLLIIALAFFACNNQPEPLSKEDSAQMEARYKEVTENNPLVHLLKEIRENKAVIDADITDANFLYISVVNDGTNKDAMATYYCRLAKEQGIDNLAAVKIIDASTAKMPHNGTAQGTELGKAFCK